MTTCAPGSRGRVGCRVALAAAVGTACALLTMAAVGGAFGGVDQLLWLGAGGGAFDRLRERVERLANGEDVAFSTDGDDEVGPLYDAIVTVASRLRAAERALGRQRERATEERARRAALLEATSDCLARVTVDEQPRVEAVNGRFEETFGHESDEVAGSPLADHLGDDGGSGEAAAAVLDGVRRGEAVKRELRCPTFEGVGDFRVRFVPVEPDGSPGEGYVVYTEVTEQSESQRRLEAIVENTSNQIFIKDREGKYRYVNEATAETFGYEPGEMVGMTDDDLFEEASAEQIRADDRRIVETGELVTDDMVTTIDGEEYAFLSNKFPYRDASGEIAGVMGISRDITRRVRSERRLQAEKERFETLVSNLPGMVYRCRNERGWPMTFVSEGCADLTGHDPSAVEDGSVSWGEDVVHSDDREDVWDDVQAALDRDEPFTLTYRIRTADGEDRWVWEQGRAVEGDDGEAVDIEGYVVDVTDRKRREQALASLHDAARELLTVESEEGVADLVVETASTVLDSTAVVLYRFDPVANQLDPVAHTGSFAEGDGDAPTVTVAEGDSPVWECFVDGTPRAFDDPGAVEDNWVLDEAGDGGLLVPLGDHGVFLVATPSPTVGEDSWRLVETLGATTEAAFDRLESEANLREQEAELEARNRRLERQVAITDIIRTIDRSLVGAESRDDIETAVCDGLVTAEDVAFAWIGHREDDETVTPLAWAGDDQGYLDAVPLGGDEPAAVTAREGTTTLVDTVGERLSAEDWARHAVERGFGAVVCVPLSIEAHAHGVLTVYAEEAGAFGELERSVFEELGGNIAYAIEAVNAQRALHADTFAELRFTFDGGDTVLGRIAREADATVEYEGLAARGDDASRMFVRVGDADAETVAAVLDDLAAVADHRLFARSEDDNVFEVTLATTSLPSRLVQAGTRPRSLSADPEGLTALVDIPAGTDVRDLVQRLTDRYDGTHLVARRDVERASTQQEVVASLFDRLTDRQLEVLRTAYFAGFFEWPRESTGEEVAELLGVSQPTVNRHLRLAQRGLLAALFDQGTHALVEE